MTVITNRRTETYVEPDPGFVVGLLYEPSTCRSKVVAMTEVANNAWVVALNPDRRSYAIVFGGDLELITEDGTTPVRVCAPTANDVADHDELRRRLMIDGFSRSPADNLMLYRLEARTEDR